MLRGDPTCACRNYGENVADEFFLRKGLLCFTPLGASPDVGNLVCMVSGYDLAPRDRLIAALVLEA
jgi:hypothetical protein